LLHLQRDKSSKGKKSITENEKYVHGQRYHQTVEWLK